MDKLIGNDKAYRTVSSYLGGDRLPHGILIEGPDGCGKTAFARYIARGAVCSAQPAQRPCGECRDCVKAEKEVHPDISVFGGEGGARSFHIDVVRSLRQDAYYRPGEARNKVFLLQNAQNMSVQAQNALLKIIEEPPPNMVFLITCDNRHALLPTILSRLALIALELPTIEECEQILEQTAPDADPQRRERAARDSGGNVGQALKLLEAEETEGVRDAAFTVLEELIAGDELNALSLLCKYERDRQGYIGLLESMRSLLGEMVLRPAENERQNRIAVRAGRLRLMQILAIIEEAVSAAEHNAGGLLLVTALCSKIKLVFEDS